MFGFGIQHNLISLKKNRSTKTTVISPKKPKKTVVGDAISRARSWLMTLVDEEQKTTKRAKVTPAWFWHTVFEIFYQIGVGPNALLCIQVADVNLKTRLIRI